MRGRPRTPMGTFGQVSVVDLGGRYRAMARVRDLDGRLRKVTATAGSSRGAQTLLKERLAGRAVPTLVGDLVEHRQQPDVVAWFCRRERAGRLPGVAGHGRRSSAGIDEPMTPCEGAGQIGCRQTFVYRLAATTTDRHQP